MFMEKNGEEIHKITMTKNYFLRECLKLVMNDCRRLFDLKVIKKIKDQCKFSIWEKLLIFTNVAQLLILIGYACIGNIHAIVLFPHALQT